VAVAAFTVVALVMFNPVAITIAPPVSHGGAGCGQGNGQQGSQQGLGRQLHVSILFWWFRYMLTGAHDKG
jgi:hypothetical protein